MAASHTDITSKTHKPEADGCKSTQPSAPNLRDLLCQHQTEPVSIFGNQILKDKSVTPVINTGISLAQLMSDHEQKSKGTGVADVSPLGNFAIGPNSPSSVVLNQNSLSLGTLASLSMSSTSHTTAPSTISASLGNLSLNYPKITAVSPSLAAPPGFGSLSSVLQNHQPSVAIGTGSKTIVADPKGSPSLADLIQEHSNRSPTLSNALQSVIPTVKCQGMATPAQTLSLSELASQHQNRRIDSQSLSTERQESAPPGLTGTLSLSQLTLQPQTSSSLAHHQPVSTESSANALKQPPGLSELLPLSHLATEHKGKTSTTSNGSQYSLTSLLLPAKPESAGVSAESTAEGGAMGKLNRKPYHQISRPLKSGQTIDLSSLMAQSHGGGHHPIDIDLPSPSSPTSPTSVALGLNLSVFAQPSIFAIALSFQSHGQRKKMRNIWRGKIKGQRTGGGYQPFLRKSLDKSKDQPTSLLPIEPFRFDTPSPDDIVRANQRKAFTR